MSLLSLDKIVLYRVYSIQLIILES